MFGQSHEQCSFTNTSKKDGTLLARLKSFSSAPPPSKWPNPQESIGQHRSTFKNQHFWDITGPGLAQLGPLKRDIKELLEVQNESLKNRETCTMLFDLFMVGKSEVDACPSLVIICSKKEPRQRVVELICKSKILDRYPGVLLGSSSKNPRYPSSEEPRSIAYGFETSMQASISSGTRVYSQRTDTESICGTSIYIPVGENIEEDMGRFRKATIGGIIMMREKDGTVHTVGMTVAHAFESLDSDAIVSGSSESSDGSEFCFEFADAALNDSSSGYGSINQLPPSPSIQTMDTSNMTVYENEPLSLPKEAPTQKFILHRYSDLEEFGVLYGISTSSSSNLDWALIQITKLAVTTVNTMRSSPIITTPSLENTKDSKDVEVVTCTGSRGATGGIMCCSSTFMKVERSTTFAEVWTVQLNGTVAYGDSGSWIVDRASETVLGHIVAGDPSSGLVFIIPKADTIQDIESQLECTVETSPEVEIAFSKSQDTIPLVVSTPSTSPPTISYNNISKPIPSSIHAEHGSCGENISPSPTIYTSAAGHSYRARYNTAHSNLLINEPSQVGDQGDFSLLARWASEYESHEARALGLVPPPNKYANQQKKEGIIREIDFHLTRRQS